MLKSDKEKISARHRTHKKAIHKPHKNLQMKNAIIFIKHKQWIYTGNLEKKWVANKHNKITSLVQGNVNGNDNDSIFIHQSDNNQSG